MSMAQEHEDGLIEILRDSAVSFTWSGADYACIASEGIAQKQVMEGGFLGEFDITITTRVTLFATLPAIGERLSFNSTEYRIVKIGKSFSNRILNLGCETVNK